MPSKLLNIGLSQAEEALLWWKEEFGDDLYIELMRHNQEDETRVNGSLIDLSRKYNVKTVATNNVFYIDKEDANAHDILLCKYGENKRHQLVVVEVIDMVCQIRNIISNLLAK